LDVRSTLLPTSILLTLSLAYRSISFIHCFTFVNDSWSVTSYTCPAMRLQRPAAAAAAAGGHRGPGHARR